MRGCWAARWQCLILLGSARAAWRYLSRCRNQFGPSAIAANTNACRTSLTMLACASCWRRRTKKMRRTRMACSPRKKMMPTLRPQVCLYARPLCPLLPNAHLHPAEQRDVFMDEFADTDDEVDDDDEDAEEREVRREERRKVRRRRISTPLTSPGKAKGKVQSPRQDPPSRRVLRSQNLHRGIVATGSDHRPHENGQVDAGPGDQATEARAEALEQVRGTPVKSPHVDSSNGRRSKRKAGS